MSAPAPTTPVPFAHLRPLRRVLAMDTSTERMSVALADLSLWNGAPGPGTAHLWSFEGAGGAQASATLIPTVLSLLHQAGWTLADLDAIALGIGPGAFTGLRTACAVVQGLAFSARPGGLPVLPLGTLHAVAEEARWQLAHAEPTPQTDPGQSAPQSHAPQIVALLDARMDECYAARFAWRGDGALLPMGEPVLAPPEQLEGALDGMPNGSPWQAGTVLAGNAMAVYGPRLPAAWQQARAVPAFPTATALLRLAPLLWQAGGAVSAAEAQPLYVRDKVAQTTAERAQTKAQQLAQAAGQP